MEQQTLPIGKQWSLFKDWSTPDTMLWVKRHELEFIIHALMMQYVNGDHNPHLDPVERITALQQAVAELMVKTPESDAAVQVLLSPVEIKQLDEGLLNDLYCRGELDEERIDGIYDAVPARVQIFLTEIDTPAFLQYLGEHDHSDADTGYVNERVHFISIGSFALNNGIGYSEGRYAKLTIEEADIIVTQLGDIADSYENIMMENDSSSYLESLYTGMCFIDYQLKYRRKVLKGNEPAFKMYDWYITRMMCYTLS